MMINLILTHTAVKGICRHIHSPHKISACDVLRSPFPIELPEPRPVGGDRLSPGVLALCLSDLDALTLSLFELFTLQLREGSEHGQHEFPCRRVGVDFLLVADEGNTLFSEGVDDVQQVLRGASETADALHIERIALTHIVQHCPELRAVCVRPRQLLGEDTVNLIVAHDLLLTGGFLVFGGNSDVSDFAHSIVLSLFECVFLSLLGELLLSVLFTLTLHLLFVDVLAHLSGVLLRRFTLGEECGMLDIKPVPLRFQLVGLLQKAKHCRRFAVNSIPLDMLPDVLDRLLVVLDCGGIFLLETALQPARFVLILLVNRLQLVMVLHLFNERVDSCKFLFQIGKLCCVVIGVRCIEEES